MCNISFQVLVFFLSGVIKHIFYNVFPVNCISLTIDSLPPTLKPSQIYDCVKKTEKQGKLTDTSTDSIIQRVYLHWRSATLT